MGCRESKLDVVTGNTVTQTKKSKDDSKRIAQPETRPDDKAGGLAAAAAEGGDSVTMDGKAGESRELDRENEGSGEEEEDVERSISRESPDHYFSSRKDDEPIEAICTEERSVYSSPPHQPAGKESMKKENLIKESEMETPRAQGLSIEDKFVNPAEI